MFYNEWDEINEMSDDDFDQPEYKDVLMDASSWHLPSPYCAIIRSWNKTKSKLKEFVYRNPHAAAEKIKQLGLRGDHVTILTKEVIATINYDPTKS